MRGGPKKGCYRMRASAGAKRFGQGATGKEKYNIQKPKSKRTKNGALAYESQVCRLLSKKGGEVSGGGEEVRLR